MFVSPIVIDPVTGEFREYDPAVGDKLLGMPESDMNYNDSIIFSDVVGADHVEAFSFQRTVNYVTVTPTGGTVRVGYPGDSPTSSYGQKVDDGIPFPFPRDMSEIQVYIPTGASVNVTAHFFNDAL